LQGKKNLPFYYVIPEFAASVVETPTNMQQIKLTIPEPCHENWQAMTPTQQGRYCNACAKQVIDFSVMSDAEVLHYFSHIQSEKVCGRAYPDQLERTIAMPSFPKKKLFWHWNYITVFFLFFFKSNSTKAQGGIAVQKVSATVPADTKAHPRKTKGQVLVNQFIVTGTVKDEAGAAIPFASISVLNSKQGTSADEDGKFALTSDQLHVILKVSALGYEVKECTMDRPGEQDIVLKKSEKILENVVINSYSMGRLSGIAGGIDITVTRRKTLADTVKNFISNLNGDIRVYPNPVQRGSSFNLSLKLKQTGACKIQITDAAGRIILIRQINAAVKLYTGQVQTGAAWSSGIYYLNVLNDNNKSINAVSFSIR
jgi:CarboxypepD_reg-like domain/Secretion system C-terminal sorting domain